MEVDDSHGTLVNKSEENDFEKKGTSDPVVYQLVRVEGDGTLVPATEDDVLQFEHFLHNEKVDLPSIEDVGHVEEFFNNDCMLPKKPDLEDGSSKLETVEVHTQKLGADLEDKADACSRPVCDTSTDPSVSGVNSSMPDFSILRGEVCLDDLTIRELQEAFRATFGRQTTVKDKIWLKRRITMGLTNSCDVPSSGCVVKDYKIVGKDAKKDISDMDERDKTGLRATSLVIYPGNEGDSPSSSYYQSEDQQDSSKRVKRVQIHNDEPQGNLLGEQCTNKRTRKPTKRYIEELSDIETHDSTVKISSPAKRPAHDEVLMKPRVAPFNEADSLGTIYPTRKDTLGGFSVHVPYVSRMRRGRPRKDFISFADKEPSVEPKGIQTAVEMILAKDGDKGNHLRKAPEVPLNVSSEKGHIEAVDSKGVQNLQAKVYSAVAKPKIKRGLTRKHHRAWTLCEVVKLVDGVARFGAGKWSEIRKLSFASYSYRTSVDLKDKWRNLIRATKTQLPAQKDGACPRKINPSIIPIPPSILLRVKELNELQLQGGGGFTAPVKFSGQDSKVLQGKGSGFL
uniref:MYB-related protein n=1 Tax=Saccharum hybrid cultivar R570 TaxID=131158 RepID=A0A059Q2J9_9POAL|nr:MYB-related protein [Saccharum hybrid cultivar R570]AGT16635.1 MYB-related protein [Saccharum hybrid cultivar R570]